MAVGMAIGLAGAAVLAATDWGVEERRRLAVLGQAGAATESASMMSSDSSVAFGGTTYRLAPGVEDLGGEATAWSVPIGADVEERVRDLAESLGLAGEVVSDEFAWSVTDGTHRLEVQRQPGLPWSYLPTGEGSGVAGSTGSAGSEPSTGGDVSVSSDGVPVEPRSHEEEERAYMASKGEATAACAMPECPPGSVCTAVCPEVDPIGPCEDAATQCLAPEEQPVPERPADLPSAAEAEARARDLLAAVGLDVDSAAVRVDDGFTSWYVSADPSVGGVPTVGMSWGVAVGAGGAVESANGWLTEPEKGDAYPLLPVATAIERLAGMSVTLELRAECPPGQACPEPEQVVSTVTGVRLALQLVASFDAEEAFLVPSYLFELDGGGVSSEMPAFAVADEYLVTPPVDQPVPMAEPLPEPLPEPGATPPGDQEPPNVGPAEPPVTAEPPVAEPPVDGSCATAAGPPEQAAPLEVEVCVMPGTAGGAPVVLTVRAADPDARVRNDCGSPLVEWGDGEPTAVCDIGVACAADEPAAPLDTSLEHIYAAPGEYEVQVTVEAVCDDPTSGSLTTSVMAVVNP